jgi:hypothetical protein
MITVQGVALGVFMGMWGFVISVSLIILAIYGRKHMPKIKRKVKE